MSGHPLDHNDQAANQRLPTNHYPGCTCPPARYQPRRGPKPTNPNCPHHGDQP